MQLFAMTEKSKPDLDKTGRCDCGANNVHVTGRPVSMFLCSCENCQRAGGAGHSAVVLFRAEDVKQRGALKSFSRPAASGATFTRHFCPECGTTLIAQSSRAPALRILPVGVFAGDNDWFKPNQLIFAREHQGWDLIDDALAHHETYRQDNV